LLLLNIKKLGRLATHASKGRQKKSQKEDLVQKVRLIYSFFC